MVHAAMAPLIGREFEPFLFASIGEDRNGKLLSVVSALARLDVDPWQEAASLARMSREAATTRLTALLSGLPDEGTALVPASTIAGKLVALLPIARPFSPPISDNLSEAFSSPNLRFGIGVSALAVMIAVALLISAGRSGAPAPAAVDAPQASAIDRDRPK